jgi:AcrR family transcriptional regulator
MVERDRRIQLREAQKILATARRLIQQEAITAVRMRDIAKTCGLTMTAPLHYFGPKGRMPAELLRVDHHQRLDRLRRGVEPCATLDELVAVLHAALGGFLEERTLRGTVELMAEITSRSTTRSSPACAVGSAASTATCSPACSTTESGTAWCVSQCIPQSSPAYSSPSPRASRPRSPPTPAGDPQQRSLRRAT